jgi:hypothetical protein
VAANRKSPQDRQPPAAEVVAEAQERFDEVEGHELLRPLSKVKGSDQTRLMARLQRLGLLDEAGDDAGQGGIADLDLDEVADLIDYISERFALDSAEFDEFTCGEGGFVRALTLVMAYVGEMGKGAA